MHLNLDPVPQPQSKALETQTIPCSVKLYRCDIVPSDHKPSAPIEVNVVVKCTNYDLRNKECDNCNKATSTLRSRHSISQNVSYVSMFHDSSSDDTANEGILETTGIANKREPLQYQLAAHKYMLASRRGVISGPRVHMRASTIIKRAKRQKTFVTKTYILRKGGTKTKSKNKRRTPYLFKCLMCELRCATRKGSNNHFKCKNHKLQCKKCKKFIHSPSAYTLHQYIHNDGQFECNVCKSCFPFKSQLDRHIVCHNESREYKFQEPFCDHDFTHKSDLVKHKHTHSGVVYQCSHWTYSNPDERNYNQYLRKHTKATPYQCKKCDQHFKYTMQLKRHRLSPDNNCS